MSYLEVKISQGFIWMSFASTVRKQGNIDYLYCIISLTVQNLRPWNGLLLVMELGLYLHLRSIANKDGTKTSRVLLKQNNLIFVKSRWPVILQP